MASLDSLWHSHQADWPGAQLIVIDLPGCEDGLDALSENTTLPVLQDTTEAGVTDAYGGARDYSYIIDSAGYPRFVHYDLQFADSAERFVSEVDQTLGVTR